MDSEIRGPLRRHRRCPGSFRKTPPLANDRPFATGDPPLYAPPHFAVPITTPCLTIERHPLGILVTHSKGTLDANHIPFELDGSKGDKGVLNCHVARKKSSLGGSCQWR
ncbi:FMN-binding negative transcriptional regulator [Mesorhizobium sp. M0983]